MKIINLLLILTVFLFSINTAIAIDGEGEFIASGSQSYHHALSTPEAYAGSWDFSHIYFSDVSNCEAPSHISITFLKAYWVGSSAESGSQNVIMKVGANQVGTGIMYFSKSSTHVYLGVITDDLDLSSYAGTTQVIIYESDGTTLQNLYGFGVNSGGNMAFYLDNDYVGYLMHHQAAKMYLSIADYYTEFSYSFSNTYDYTIYPNYLDFNLYRTATDQSKLKIEYNTEVLIEETTLQSSNLNYIQANTTKNVWDLTLENAYGDVMTRQINLIQVDMSKCYINCDSIDIGENIEINYYNIDDLRENPIYYGSNDFGSDDLYLQVLCDRGYYNELIYADLILDEEDSTVFYSSLGLSPGIYYSQINLLYKGLDDYAVRTHFLISEPANFSITVNPDDVYVGDTVNLIYKALNSSTLSVFDNDDTKIDTWINLHGQSQIVYQVPIDASYDYSYNDWYVYLNDSGNSSNNIRSNFTVQWYVYVEPTPTVDLPDDTYNVTVEEGVQQMKDGFEPLFDLVFGMSTIFVDNPDYNNDNVIDSNELSAWFNSLISICIIILLYILYKVYNRK